MAIPCLFIDNHRKLKLSTCSIGVLSIFKNNPGTIFGGEWNEIYFDFPMFMDSVNFYHSFILPNAMLSS